MTHCPSTLGNAPCELDHGHDGDHRATNAVGLSNVSWRDPVDIDAVAPRATPTELGTITQTAPTEFVRFHSRQGAKALALTPEHDVVFYRPDGTEQYRCPLERLVDIIRHLAETTQTHPTMHPPWSTPTVSDVDGELVVDWPNPRPRLFEITSDAFQALIDRANRGQR